MLWLGPAVMSNQFNPVPVREEEAMNQRSRKKKFMNDFHLIENYEWARAVQSTYVLFLSKHRLLCFIFGKKIIQLIKQTK